HGSGGKRFPVTIDCLGADDDCQGVSDKLDAAGVPASIAFEHARVGSETLRVVVGPWDKVQDDVAAGEIEAGPKESGVFAAFDPKPGGGYQLTALNVRNQESKTLGPGTGLVAATKLENEQPTWVVTGTDEAGVRHAVDLLDTASLRDHYAVAVDDHGKEIALPTP